MPSPRRRWSVWVLSCVVALAGCRPSQPAIAPPAPPEVTVSRPLSRTVMDHIDATGRTAAVEAVDIRARVSGYLEKVQFDEGAEVTKGQPLFQIDPRPFQAEFDRLTAQVAVREATLKYRGQELERSKQLLPSAAISKADFDLSVAQYDEAVAGLAAAKANTEGAKLDLEFSRIAAPISGRISRTHVTPGNLITADSTLLTTLVSVDPVYIYFEIDENTLQRIERAIREGKIKAEDEASVPLTAALTQDEGHPHQGRMDFADNRINTSTGTITIRGVFPNPRPKVGNRMLIPGLFCRVRVPIGSPYQAVLVPERALGSDQGQRFVYVVNARDEVEYRRVTPGRMEGELRVVQEGIGPEERIVVRGIQRVKPGMKVTPREAETAAAKPVPTPEVAPTGEGAAKPPAPSDGGAAAPKSS